jgi:tetratricopeptide (TPR) repeat protein
MRFGWSLVALSVVVVLIPAPAISQVSTSLRGLYISGTIRDDATQQPLSAVTLELRAEAGGTAAPPVVSGTNGDFVFSGLVSGNYWIVAHQKGYEPSNFSLMLGGIPLSNVIVNLRRIESDHAPGPGDAISTHQLSIPEKARDLFDKGIRLMTGTKPDYRKALANFERAAKEYPDYYEAYAEMGIAQQHLGDAVAAEKALRKSVEMSASRYPDALFLLAEMLNDAGRFIDSQVFARQCVTQDESSWTCDLELARALAGLKHPVEAEAIALKASELNPNNPKTFLVLGNIHIEQRKYDAVLKDFETYLKLDPSGPLSDQVRASEAQARRALAKTPAVNRPSQ